MFTVIDRAVLDWHERLSHKIQLWVGIDCMLLSRICASIWLPHTVFLNAKLIATNKATWLDYTAGSFVLLLTVRYIIYGKPNPLSYSAGLSNRYKIDPIMFAIRIVTIVEDIIFSFLSLLPPVRLSDVWTILTSAAIIGCFYFMSCDPLPPCTSKLRRFLSYRHQKLALESNRL